MLFDDQIFHFDLQEMQTQNTSNFSGSASNPFSVGMGAGVVNYQISQQLSALKKSTQHCQVWWNTSYKEIVITLS